MPLYPNSRYLIGIAGESASGKSTLCEELVARTPHRVLAVLGLDSYYHTRSDASLDSVSRPNFDHPKAFDHRLLIDHLDELRAGRPIHVPQYDFVTHRRCTGTTTLEPAPVVIVEGILALYWPELRARYNWSLFLRVPSSVRLQRRIARDTNLRGRTRVSVMEQWNQTVEPMATLYCTPTQHLADMVVEMDSPRDGVIDQLLERILANC